MRPLVIVGSGNVGKALYLNCKRNGVEVLLASRSPEKVDSTVNPDAVIPLAEASAQGEILVLALPMNAAIDYVKSVGNWNGKILIDATNPLLPGLEGLSVGTSMSGGELIAEAASGANVVKAFNTTGAENLADHMKVSAPVFTPICGDDSDSKATVIELANKLGFDAIDFGDLKTARYTEAFAMTWIHLAIKKQAGRNWAFSRTFSTKANS